jgi:hypothetical protein
MSTPIGPAVAKISSGYSTGSIASGIKLPLILIKHDGQAKESALWNNWDIKMARQTSVRITAFGQLEELTRELSELAPVVNARFIADDNKLREIKKNTDTPSDSRSRIGRT